jgi:hypothetical protein
MNETAYLKIRAQHFSQLAMETLDPHAKAYYGAIAADVTAKFKVVNPKQPAILICGVAVDPRREHGPDLLPGRVASPLVEVGVDLGNVAFAVPKGENLGDRMRWFYAPVAIAVLIAADRAYRRNPLSSKTAFPGTCGRRAVRVLGLDPIPRAAGPIRRVDPLRHDALKPHAAGLGEHARAFRLDMLVEREAMSWRAQAASPAAPCAP